jgi:hypothetical protein
MYETSFSTSFRVDHLRIYSPAKIIIECAFDKNRYNSDVSLDKDKFDKN